MVLFSLEGSVVQHTAKLKAVMQKFIIENKVERRRNYSVMMKMTPCQKGQDVLNASCDRLVSLEEHVACPPGKNLSIFILLIVVHEN